MWAMKLAARCSASRYREPLGAGALVLDRDAIGGQLGLRRGMHGGRLGKLSPRNDVTVE